MKKLLTLISLLACFSAFSNPIGSTLIRSSLFIAATDGTTTLVDGDLTQYDPSYSNSVDGMDARKMSNFSENIGMIRGTTTLVIERRHTIENTDTIFYKIWNLSLTRNYQLQFNPSNMLQPGLTAFLQDRYMNTNTPVSLTDTSFVNFSINADPASSDAYRFRLIFTTAAVGGALPVVFTGERAYQHNSAVNIDWSTATENNMKDYAVQRSADGSHYSEIGTVKANNLPANNYTYSDGSPLTGVGYYRIMSTGLDGNTKYSTVMKVDVGNGFALMKVFPNPVINKTIMLQVLNEPAGVYQVRLLNNFGQQVMSQQLQHPGGSSTVNIVPPQSIPHGIYHLAITEPGGIQANISIVY
ncbi:MAG: hypothetical protein ACHQF4_10330 [Sphingobacteriales bacterium]